jgi:hypothetical protein
MLREGRMVSYRSHTRRWDLGRRVGDQLPESDVRNLSRLIDKS